MTEMIQEGLPRVRVELRPRTHPLIFDADTGEELTSTIRSMYLSIEGPGLIARATVVQLQKDERGNLVLDESHLPIVRILRVVKITGEHEEHPAAAMAYSAAEASEAMEKIGERVDAEAREYGETPQERFARLKKAANEQDALLRSSALGCTCGEATNTREVGVPLCHYCTHGATINKERP